MLSYEESLGRSSTGDVTNESHNFSGPIPPAGHAGGRSWVVARTRSFADNWVSTTKPAHGHPQQDPDSLPGKTPKESAIVTVSRLGGLVASGTDGDLFDMNHHLKPVSASFNVVKNQYVRIW
jgi:hypothetical protein